MTKQTKIDFIATSYEGHTDYSLLPKEALRKIREIEKEENKWVYIGGKITNTETLTESDLQDAQSNELVIALINAQAGGNREKVVEINFAVEKDVEGIVIDFVEEDYAKYLYVAVGKNDLIDIVHNREQICNAIRRKLDEFAEREVNGLKKALNV